MIDWLIRKCRRAAPARAVPAWYLFVALWMVTSPSAADDTITAKQQFAEGMEAFGRGNHRAAAEAFSRAFALAPRGATAYNEGLAWHAAGHLARAADAFRCALDMGGLTDAQRIEAETRYSAIRPHVGLVTVEAPAGTLLSLAHRHGSPAPLRIHLDPGTYTVEADFPDRSAAHRAIEVRAGEVMVIIAPATPLPAPHHPSPVVTPPRQPSGVAPDGESVEITTWLGWIALGGSAVCAGTAVYLGLEAIEARDRYYRSAFTDASARNRAGTYRTWTNVAWAGAGVLTGVSVFSLSYGTSRDKKTAPERVAGARVGPGHLWVEGTF